MPKMRHRDVFFAANGFGPYECFGCKEEVALEDIIVHHLDHNCHNRYHMNCNGAASRAGKSASSEEHSRALREKWQDPEYREKVTTALTGKVRSEDARKNYRRAANMTAGRAVRSRGGRVGGLKSKTPEHCRRISEAKRGKPISPEHAAALHAGSRRRWERFRQEKEGGDAT